MAGKIQLVLPGLFDIPAADCDAGVLQQGLPHLNHLLRFAAALPNRAYSIDAILHDILLPEAESPSARGLALAQAAAGETAAAARLLLFKPVHLQPGLHNALIVPIDETDENLKDITIIINELKDLFKVDCNITAASSGLFLMRLEDVEPPDFYPHFLSVLGKPANPYISQSRKNLPWNRLLNEMQMFMHQHPVNEARTARGQLTINSLWCWGAGEAPTAPVLPQAWYCDDDLLGRYAASLGLSAEPLRNVETAPAASDKVVIDLRLLQALKSGAEIPLEQLLEEIDTSLLGPLLQRIGRDRGRLRLRAGHRFDFEIGALSRLRFWRKNTSLAGYLQTVEPA